MFVLVKLKKQIMKAPINYPCVMLDKADTIGLSITEKNLLNKFSLIENEADFYEKSPFLNEPVICHYYSVVNEAIRLTKIVSH